MDLPPHLNPQGHGHHHQPQILQYNAPPAVANPTPAISPPPKRRRTAAALSDCCRTCRLRKVKCSGKPGNGPCVNCSRLELSCSFENANATQQQSGKVSRSTPSHSHTEAGTLRKRAQRACSQCHSHKTKCSGDLPSCKRCDAAGLACEYTVAKRKFSSVVVTPSDACPASRPSLPVEQSPDRHSSAPSITTTSAKSEGGIASPATSISTGNKAGQPGVASGSDNNGNFPLQIDTSTLTSQELLNRKDFILRHMDAYFENLYWIPCLGIFHPDTTYRQIHEGTFPPAHAAAVCAISSFFVNPGEAAREFGRKCADQVEFHLFHNCYRFDENILCGFALNGAYNFLNGSFAKVWQCSGIACRLMLGLQINWEAATRDRPFVEQETMRRMAWQIFNMDRLLAGGYEEYISCRPEVMKIRLPCNDRAYRENIPLVVEKLYETSSKCRNAMGLHGHQLRLVDVTHRIQVATKKLISPTLASRTSMEPSKVMAEINGLQTELARIGASLPDDLRLSDQSILRYVAAQERPGFVFLHTHLLAAHIDLYRFALPCNSDATAVDLSRKLPHEFLAKSQKQAVAHALCLARFCDAVLRVFERLPKSGRLQLAGDCTIASIATQSLRVLLIALEHELYQDLAENSSAPLWRNEPADEAHIRVLITSLLRISEPWSQLLQVSAQAHKANLAMVIEFDRTRKFADQRGTRFIGAGADGNTQFPGPNFILENARAGTIEDEKRSRASHSAAQKRWFNTPRSPIADAPTPYDVPEVEYDGEDGPPGLPMFLARARGTTGQQAFTAYGDGQQQMMGMEAAPKPWTIPELNEVLAGDPNLLGADGMPLIQLDQPGPGMFDQAPQIGAPFMNQQVGMFLGYPQQYAQPSAPPPEPTYMQQASYG